MGRFALGSLVALIASASLSAHAAKNEERATAFVLCKNQKTVRTIRILPEQNPQNCRVTYSKGGVEEVVGANSSTGTCQTILKNIQANLESAKWNCRGAQAAVVTTSSEVLHQ